MARPVLKILNAETDLQSQIIELYKNARRSVLYAYLRYVRNTNLVHFREYKFQPLHMC
jgi:hypothetical protein